jgi:hypothetical protein
MNRSQYVPIRMTSRAASYKVVAMAADEDDVPD